MSREDEILEKSKLDIERLMSKVLTKKDEQIAELKAEVLELRTVETTDLEPITYAYFIIDEYKNSGRENWLDDIAEIAEHLQIYFDRHQFDDGETEEGEEE